MLATLVIAVCTARALVSGVQLVSERALLEIRARDVFSAHPPLLGLRSSSGQTSDGFNHLGPALFWWLAPFTRLLGGPVGVTIGVAALNIASVWAAVVAARSSGGTRLALATGAAVTALCWTLGSELLVDPWQPNALVLPFFALLATTTAVVCGHFSWLPATVAIASLCMQTHLGHVLLGPAMVLTAVGAIAWRARGAHGPPPWRVLAMSAVIVVVMWIPVMWQQFAGPGRGNLSAVIEGGSGAGQRTGLDVALRVWSAVTMRPPAWLRPSFLDPPQALMSTDNDRIGLDLGELPSRWSTLLTVIIAAGIAVLVAASARRRRIDGSSAGILVAAVGTTVAVVTLALIPLDLFGVVAHKYRYLWPLAAFGAAVVVGHIVGVVERTAGRRGLHWAITPIAAVMPLVAVLGVVTQPIDLGPVTNRDLWPALRELRSQLEPYRRSRVVVETSGLPFPDHFSHAVLAELSENGVAFQVTTDVMVSQLGSSRRADGSATHRLVIRQAPHHDRPTGGGRRIARVDISGVPAVAVYEIAE